MMRCIFLLGSLVSRGGIEAFQALSSSITTKHNALLSSSSSQTALSLSDRVPIVVALTREEGKNGKLLKALEQDQAMQQQIQAIELPCIAHANGPDYDKLKAVLQDESWDYVVVTSPEAARVLASAWSFASSSVENKNIKVAAVGKATEIELVAAGIPVAFTPSKAYAETLAQELPPAPSTTTRLLYPASCRAQDTLQNGFQRRTDTNFAVTRLNTYDTVTATWSEHQQQVAQSCHIVTFASPSSVRGWLANSSSNNTLVLAACIGETSAKACLDLGWNEPDIFRPTDNIPGVEGWVEAVRQAVTKIQQQQCQQQNQEQEKAQVAPTPP